MKQPTFFLLLGQLNFFIQNHYKHIINQHLGHLIGKKFGVLSGPNLAKEIAENKIAGTVIASEFDEVNLEIKSM